MNEFKLAGVYMWIVFAILMVVNMTGTMNIPWWVLYSPLYAPLLAFIALFSIAWAGHILK